jgi:tetrahydromethanopterin S-methyltransferase subunit G
MKNIDKRQDKLEEKVDNIEANLNKWFTDLKDFIVKENRLQDEDNKNTFARKENLQKLENQVEKNDMWKGKLTWIILWLLVWNILLPFLKDYL